eukprot:scaffold1077_cov191-Alexandrium_tamarense.AAC.20
MATIQRGVGYGDVWIGMLFFAELADRQTSLFTTTENRQSTQVQTDQQTVQSTTTAEQCHLDAEEEVVSAVEAPVEEGVEVAVGEEGGAFVMKGHPTRLSVSVDVAGLLFLNVMSTSCV